MGFDGITVDIATKPDAAAAGMPDVQTLSMEFAHFVSQARRTVQSLDAGSLQEVTIRTDTITLMIQALGDIRKVIENATIEDKARVYDQLGLRLIYAPGTKTIRAEMNLSPDRGVMVSVRGGIDTITPPNTFRIYSEISIENNRSPAPIDPVSVRTWARSQGLDVADRGRLPSAVVKAWQAVHRK